MTIIWTKMEHRSTKSVEKMIYRTYLSNSVTHHPRQGGGGLIWVMAFSPDFKIGPLKKEPALVCQKFSKNHQTVRAEIFLKF